MEGRKDTKLTKGDRRKKCDRGDGERWDDMVGWLRGWDAWVVDAREKLRRRWAV